MVTGTDKVYSTQLWQLVKTWEMMQEFGLEGRGRDLFGSTADSLTWCNTIPAETAPSTTNIPDGPAGTGGSALTNEYFTASWYELQIVRNSGNHQHRDRSPVDWTYLIGRFLGLYAQTHQPEPTRLLVAVTKALQSTDPRLGPDDPKTRSAPGPERRSPHHDQSHLGVNLWATANRGASSVNHIAIVGLDGQELTIPDREVLAARTASDALIHNIRRMEA